VAHDFNNLLTAIRGHAEFARGELPAHSMAHEDVEEIIRAADRAAGLTRQLLAFSRKQVLQPRVVDLDAIVESVDKLLRRVLGEDVRLVTALSVAPCRVLADAGQIEQVLVNLAVNARDAMPNGGTLTLRTAIAGAGAVPEASARAAFAGRRVVLLSVADTGVGMNAETRERAFEPFFTTKGEGKGTGLGLATVYGIVEQSGGAVWIDSAEGRGTTVWVALPYAEAEDDARDEDGASALPVAPVARGTILLVEDEDAVRTLAERILTRAGYAVVAATNGAEALAAWHDRRSCGEEIEVVLSDIVMPDCGGPELARRLRADDPGVVVLLMSGYLGAGVDASGVLDGGTTILEKPFTAEGLLRHVAEASAARRMRRVA
jgi:CheY-like chemotaxis protein